MRGTFQILPCILLNWKPQHTQKCRFLPGYSELGLHLPAASWRLPGLPYRKWPCRSNPSRRWPPDVTTKGSVWKWVISVGWVKAWCDPFEKTHLMAKRSEWPSKQWLLFHVCSTSSKHGRLENHHFKQEIHLQMVVFPLSCYPLPPPKIHIEPNFKRTFPTHEFSGDMLVLPRFGLDECAAYWQQVVDMNDHQKTAFTSILTIWGWMGWESLPQTCRWNYVSFFVWAFEEIWYFQRELWMFDHLMDMWLSYF